MEISRFSVLPLEIMELICENLEDPEDIMNAVKDNPSLVAVLVKKRFSWTASLIFPLIVPKYLTGPDILKCRLVSRRWRNGIDKLLENFPTRLPYKSSPISKLFTEHHFNFHSLPKFVTNLQKVMTFAEYPVSQNPFIGRYVEICEGGNEDNQHEIKSLSEILPLLEKFGHHIWYAVFQLDDFNEQVIHQLFQCLSQLVNLKFLKVSVKAQSCQEMVHGAVDAANLASFPAQLESLDLSEFRHVSRVVYRNILNRLVNHDKIKKLGLNLLYWDGIYNRVFPNISELYIRSSCYLAVDGLLEIEQLLRELCSPTLQTLRILNCHMNVTALLKLLQNYPQIESLELVGYHLCEDVAESSDELIKLPSIRDLKIRAGDQLHFCFLRRLPSLRYLTISEDPHRIHRDTCEIRSKFGKQLNRYFFMNQYEPSNFAAIWEDLPALEMLNLFGNDSVSRQYIREDRKRVFTPYVSRPRHDFDE